MTASPPTPALGESDSTEFENANVSEIERGRNPAEAKVDYAAAAAQKAALDKAKLDRMNGDTKRMQHLFWFVVGLVSAVVIGVYVAFALYMKSEWGRVPSQAVIALIAGTVVEVIGILAVITRYLYRIEKDEAGRSS